MSLNINNKLHELSDQVFELQEKLTDQEYKTLLDNINFVYTNLPQNIKQKRILQEQPQSIQHSNENCPCDLYSRSSGCKKLEFCKHKDVISLNCPLICYYLNPTLRLNFDAFSNTQSIDNNSSCEYQIITSLINLFINEESIDKKTILWYILLHTIINNFDTFVNVKDSLSLRPFYFEPLNYGYDFVNQANVKDDYKMLCKAILKNIKCNMEDFNKNIRKEINNTQVEPNIDKKKNDKCSIM